MKTLFFMLLTVIGLSFQTVSAETNVIGAEAVKTNTSSSAEAPEPPVAVTEAAAKPQPIVYKQVGSVELPVELSAETLNEGENLEAPLENSAAVPVNLNEVKRRITYPQIAQDGRLRGETIVRIKVSKDGLPLDYEMLYEAHPLLGLAVWDKLDDLRFKPAIKNGKAVDSFVQLTVQFEL